MDASLTALQTAWKRPDAAKVSDDLKKMADGLKKRLDEIRPTFTARNFIDTPSAEDRKAELLKPEPDFVLPALLARINQQINGLENFAAAPSDSDAKQMTLTKAAMAKADADIAQLRGDVVKFNDAVNAAKIPVIPVP